MSVQRLQDTYAALNELRAQGGYDRVPRVFEQIADGYNAPHGFGNHYGETAEVQFGRTRYLICRHEFLNALTAIALRDVRIAQLEDELERLRGPADVAVTP